MIRELREELASDLAVIDGVKVESSWPDRVTPPLIFVQPAEAGSYVFGGPAFGEFTISIDVQIVIRDRDLDKLESLVEAVLSNTVDWALLGVDTPGPFTANGIEYFGTTVHLSKPARP